MKLLKQPFIQAYYWIGFSGFTIIFLVCFFLIVPPFTPYDPYHVNMSMKLQTISLDHWLGTDGLGRDVLSRILAGGQLTLGASLIVLLGTVIIGLPIGVLSGFVGGKLDRFFMRIADSFLAFPDFLIAIVLTGLLGPHLVNLVIAIIAVKWIAYARIARNTVQVEMNKEYIAIAKVNGVGRIRTMRKHLLPYVMRQVIALMPLDIGKIILMIASLSYIGLGVQPPGVEWGAMLNEGKMYFYQAPRLMILPGLAIMIIVILANLTGDRVQDRLGLSHRKSGR
ncbi:peptide ABC transporter permease [Shouchella clausii]|uniref:Dipeptide/oligopeptide/nickel ABC transporter permease n=1 Tax=Shouchella clausii (strain KSM-K16) TaxID=66692 RepID=Q5WLI0_SHOC1|nr:nickel transporter permease [Shouchella clausii]KKI86317.1 nickel transporter permease NikC [Shouchella clausii]BAD62775.1 dipeptide/oligopeptide/nickel ABC transporter permease [Shouchella clausii KSM-K16]GIN08618.1 peptide ABC transporter permease [Shouchella clausii]